MNRVRQTDRMQLSRFDRQTIASTGWLGISKGVEVKGKGKYLDTFPR